MNKYLKLIRIDKPIGIWLLFFPCLFGLALSYKQQNFDVFYFVSLFFAGSFLMRSAGCIINDIWDQDFDKKVSRTKSRPIASGQISLRSSFILLTILLILSFFILLQFNLATIILGCVSLILVIFYPAMKRITFYPQLFLGLTFNIGVLLAFIAVLGKITIASFILYLACIIWTIIYDTIYGYQDLEDDLKIGLKSTAIKFGHKPQRILFTLIFIYSVLLLNVGFLAELKFAYFIFVAMVIFLLCYQIKNCNFANEISCLQKFKSNIWVGILLLIGILAG